MHKTRVKCSEIIFKCTTHDNSPQNPEATVSVFLQLIPIVSLCNIFFSVTYSRWHMALLMLLQMQVAQRHFFELFVLLVDNVLLLVAWCKGLGECSNHRNYRQFLVYSNSRREQDSTKWQLIREWTGMKYMLTHLNTCLKVLLGLWKWVSNSRVLKHVSGRCLSLGKKFHENMNMKRGLGYNIEIFTLVMLGSQIPAGLGKYFFHLVAGF